jgi:hypothetical protein
VGWPGSVADGRVWSNSGLKRKIETFLGPLPTVPVATVNGAGVTINELVPAFILADSAYPNTTRVVTTFKNTECARCQVTKHLNARLAGARYYVENAFGICKGRFRVLTRPLECATEDITRAITLVGVICTLHNFLIDVRDDTDITADTRPPGESFETNSDADLIDVREQMETGRNTTREILLRHMRWIEEGEEV